ncbi:Peptide transporter [Spraguea lophii 42_110]|uniref:Peptide transporter n=1 Tax=Spraguea lophii (strain 42_110) TaxID=1358809 RepID=S7XK66_SPRLO|nr:Peptide transporter [Spraguea lophii 42_110]
MKYLPLILIVSNEFCERFCFYGLRSLLFPFLREKLSMSVQHSTIIVHLFYVSCYLFAIVGGILSDSIWGRFKTILILSLFYIVGCFMLFFVSLLESNLYLFFLGLALISIGTGGIKPAISTFGGDQFRNNSKKELSTFFSVFYFFINAGAMLSVFITPILSNLGCLDNDTCYPLSFGLPTLLLMISIILFTLGSDQFIKLAPNSALLERIFLVFTGKTENKGKNDGIENLKKEFEEQIFDDIIYKYANDAAIQHSFISEPNSATNKEQKQCEMFFKPVDITHPTKIEKESENTQIEDKNELQTIKSLFKVFLPTSCFWMVYDQQSSSWIEQADKMNLKIFNTRILPAQMQSFNAILTLLFIPIFNKLIYPRISLAPVQKMGIGMICASLSFIIAAIVETVNRNHQISILYQIPQYILIVAGEIFLVITGLEFAYTNSPKDYKSIILSAWLLMVSIGNSLVIIITSLNLFPPTNKEIYSFLFYAFICLISSIPLFTSKYKNEK